MAKQSKKTDPTQVNPPDAEPAVKPGEQPPQVKVDDSIRAAVKDKFLSRLFKEHEDEPQKKDEGDPDPNPAPSKAADDTTAKPKEAAKPEPQDEPNDEPTAAAPAPVIDEERLAKAIAAGNEGLVSALKQSQAAPKPSAEPIPEIVAKKRHIYDKLSEMFPEKYPNQTEAMAAFARAEAKYLAKWEEEHEGEQFDPDDEQHNAWYAKHMPKIDSEDLDEAKIQVRIDRELTKIRSEADDKVESVRREIRERDFKTEAESLKAEAYGPVLAAIDADLAGTSLEELASKDKLANKVVRSEVDRVFPFIQEIARLERRIVDYDASNPDHKAIAGLLNGVEEAIAAVPANKRVRDGKQWVSRKEWSKLGPRQRENHWIVSEQDLRNNVLTYVGAQAKAKYEELRELLDLPKASASTAKSTDKAQRKPSASEVPAFLSASAPVSDVPAPSVRATTQINAPASRGNQSPKTGKDLFMDRLVAG